MGERGSMALQGERQNMVEAAFGNKDSDNTLQSPDRGVRREDCQGWKGLQGAWRPRGKPAFVTRKGWVGALRQEVENLRWFGGWGPSSSRGLGHRELGQRHGGPGPDAREGTGAE